MMGKEEHHFQKNTHHHHIFRGSIFPKTSLYIIITRMALSDIFLSFQSKAQTKLSIFCFEMFQMATAQLSSSDQIG